MDLIKAVAEEEKLYEYYMQIYEDTDNCIFRDIAREKETHIRYLKEIIQEAKERQE